MEHGPFFILVYTREKNASSSSFLSLCILVGFETFVHILAHFLKTLNDVNSIQWTQRNVTAFRILMHISFSLAISKVQWHAFYIAFECYPRGNLCISNKQQYNRQFYVTKKFCIANECSTNTVQSRNFLYF